MKLFIKYKRTSKEPHVEKIDEEHFIVAVKERPIEGKANEAITEALADYFNVAKSKVTLVSGHASREKLFEIL
ncbi:MAG: hypothetical protein A3B30_00685 [Candidatus Komeilibacteria bacterium RIFCSPLOWO2_01_FULL_52_15]|uniref:Uncharacterized protein n=2 Tax=Candidatus Komeiliibacteriota TaxID=1817908 RepID=A0A1G2BQU6_9BACT|nr:MAG: hypothetical protein A2677_03125 [Candidatus Komeilibacteria bacterium RIFCSPHIGHO2_01_FULL_52_14]OGY91216.1 MAG: hypothetical protein A3B30_00685 [Candidatus Komeilibacteria bacterium RIFCSPLOWO2_01_FULL_52_15]